MLKKCLTYLALFLCAAAVFGQEAPEVAVFPQLGHSKTIYSVAFSPDGKWIVSGSGDKTLKLWDTENGREIRTFAGHSDVVTSVAFSPDGTQIVSGSGSSDRTVKLWDAQSGQEIRSFVGHLIGVNSVAFSPNGKQIISGSGDTTVNLWDVASGRKIRSFSGHLYTVTSVVFSPDGKQMVSGSSDETIKLWDVESGREIRSFSGHSDDVTSVVSSPDGKQMVSGSGDKTVKLWDVESGREIRSFSGHSDDVTSVAFSPDGKQIISGSGDETIKLWDAQSGREIRSFSGHSGWSWSVAFSSVAFSPDGKRIVSGSEDGSAKLWDAESGQEIHSFSGHSHGVISVARSPNGIQIVSGSGDGTVTLWDAESGWEVRSFAGHSKWVGSVAFSPDGTQIVSGSWDETIKLWNVESGREIRSFSGHSRGVESVAFSPDGRRIISGSGDSTVKLWDAESGREIRTFSGHSDPVHSVAFSPDGRWIISGSSDSTIKLWDAESGREIRTFSGYSDIVISVAFSPDGKRIVSGSRTVTLWDAESGWKIRTFFEPLAGQNSIWVNSVAFSPDGKLIVSGSSSSDGAMQLWDAASGREIRSVSGHSSFVTFSPGGWHIVSGSGDGTVRVWDAESGEEIAAFISFSGGDSDVIANTRGISTAAAEKAASIDGEWICITPDGYYAASPRGDRYLNVRVGNKVTGVDSFRHIFYNPDVVEARLAGEPDPPSKKTVTIQEAASFFPPAITLRPALTAAGTANLAVTIADDNRPLQNIKIAVNGRLIGREELAAVTGPGLRPEKASFTVTGNQKTVNFTLPLALDPGENLVEVVAYNGFAESRQKTTLTRQGGEGPERELPQLWILAVGVNEYESEHIMNLSYCANDAREIVASFKAQEGKRYSQVNALLIADGEDVVPTAQNIRENLSFLGRAGPRDVILLFLAGHGITGQDGAFYFLPRDTVSDGTVSPGSAISGDEITTVLDAPGNRLIFIDACHSGGVDSDRMTRKLMDTNAFVFTASRGSEYSQERADLEHGVFTYTVIEGLRTGKRSLGMLQLSGEVQLEVPRMTADQQHPSAYSLGFYDFIIGE